MTAPNRKMQRDWQRRQKRAALEAARKQGCVCKPVVQFVGHRQVVVRHDDWCPLLRVMQERPPQARTQAVVYDPEEFGDDQAAR